MSEQTSFLPSGPLPFIGPDFHVLGMVGRVGDGFVYTARDGLKQARLREYCPRNLTLRGASGAMLPRHASYAHAWQEGIRRFVAQGERLATLEHPGVAPIWAALTAETTTGPPMGGYTIGEPVGESLAATLASGLQLAADEILRFARELAAALAAVHQQGLTHLDIAPQTVTIAQGRVQLTDFTVDNRDYMPLLGTQDGLIRPGYSPLEIYEGPTGEPLGPAADIYAASALLFRLITGAAPAPATQRFRDPSASQLDGREGFSGAFIDAIRRGLALEARDRFADGADWFAALSDPVIPTGLSIQKVEVRAVPPATPPRPIAADQPPLPPAPARRGNWLLPGLLVLLLMLAVAVAALAYRRGWFGSEAEEPGANQVVTPREPTPPRKGEPAIPTLRAGEARNGTLSRTDARAESGQYQDRFTLVGRRGERIELRLSSDDFDPRLTLRGNGLNQFNDDDLENESLNSRMVVTLPTDGTYTILVSSYEQDRTGAYRLEAAAAPDADPRPPNGASQLVGAWRLEEDPGCTDPATITVTGATLMLTRQGIAFRERILADDGRRVRTRVDGGDLDGQEFTFDLGEGGTSFTTDEGTWLRCEAGAGRPAPPR